jgi:hypothetical protein
MAVQTEMYAWLHEASSSGRVAIFDATNTTRDRREALAHKALGENAFLLFIESICDDKETLVFYISIVIDRILNHFAGKGAQLHAEAAER